MFPFRDVFYCYFIVSSIVLYKLSKIKTTPVKKRLDCLMRQNQKVLFISFVVFAEQRTTVK